MRAAREAVMLFLVQHLCKTLCIAGLHLTYYGYVCARSDGGTAGSPEGDTQAGGFGGTLITLHAISGIPRMH